MKKLKRGIQYKRKKEGKTNYRKRLTLLKSKKPRFVVRKSLKNIRAQVVKYSKKGDTVIASAFSKELRKFGWEYSGNLPTAYLTGMLCGVRAKKAKCNEAVLDIGLSEPIPGSKLYAALKGAVDSNLNIPCNEKIFPSEERLQGNHIVDYATKLKKENPTVYKKQFSNYLKKKIKLENLKKDFETVKKKIQESK